MVFVEFRSKFTKFWRTSWTSRQARQAFTTGFPMLSMGSIWIFSGIALKNQEDSRAVNVPYKLSAQRLMVKTT